MNRAHLKHTLQGRSSSSSGVGDSMAASTSQTSQHGSYATQCDMHCSADFFQAFLAIACTAAHSSLQLAAAAVSLLSLVKLAGGNREITGCEARVF